tara:strand:- start:160 stop:513 length:354 start_codon:yes stop_codon:yes gene_type:complete
VNTINSIKTIDVSALEWFDSINGNSYFAGKVIINYGADNQITLPLAYQYGYGEQYEYTALEAIKQALRIATGTNSLWSFCNSHNIILRSNKRSAKKAELKEIQKAFELWEVTNEDSQ